MIRATESNIVSIMMCVMTFFFVLSSANAQECDDELVVAPGPIPAEFFGKAVAIDGSTMVVGAPGSVYGNSTLPGRAIVYTWMDGDWVIQAILTFSHSVDGDAFGMSVAVDNETIVIGAPRMFNHRKDRTGIGFVYERPPDGWMSTDLPDAILYSPEGHRNDLFGNSVAIDGDWILVGSPQDDGDLVDIGSVSAFKRAPGTKRGWIEEQIFFRPTPRLHEHFGGSIAIHGNWAVVGASNVDWHTLPGTVHFYQREESNEWVHRKGFNGGPDRQPGDHFGRALALDRRPGDLDSVLAIGATGSDELGNHSGSVHLFRFIDPGNGPRWTREQKIIASNGGRGDHFGFSVSALGDTLLVGAHAFDLPIQPNVGSSYVFRYRPSRHEWVERKQILADCPHPYDALGFRSVLYLNPVSSALEAIVAAPGFNRDGIFDAGAVIRIRN